MMVAMTHSVVGITMARKTKSSFSVAGRVMMLVLSANVFLFVTTLMPFLRPEGFAESEDTFSLERVADACFTNVVSTVISTVFAVPLTRGMLTDPNRSNIAGLLLGSAINIVLLVVNSVLVAVSIALEGFAFNPSALSVTFLMSFALGVTVSEPFVIVFRFFALGVRAIQVHEGGNGGNSARFDAAVTPACDPSDDDALQLFAEQDTSSSSSSLSS